MSKAENQRMAVLATEMGLSLGVVLIEYGWSQQYTDKLLEAWIERARENRQARLAGLPMRDPTPGPAVVAVKAEDLTAIRELLNHIATEAEAMAEREPFDIMHPANLIGRYPAAQFAEECDQAIERIDAALLRSVPAGES